MAKKYQYRQGIHEELMEVWAENYFTNTKSFFTLLTILLINSG